jgi:hypothetical protein
MAGPLIAVGDTLQLRIACRQAGQNGMNVLHYRVSAVVGAMDLIMTRDQFDTLAAPLYKAVMTANADYYGVAVRRLVPNPSLEFTTSASTGPGTVAGDSAPKQASIVVTKRSATPGRGFRGRMYIPFPGDAATFSDGSPTPAYVTLVDGIALALLTNLTLISGANSVSLIPAILHRATTTVTDMVGYEVRKRFGNQRRRGDYGKVEPAPW